MIKIEYKDDKYYVNGEEVVDELQFDIRTRKALHNFKKAISDGLKVQSRIYTSKENK